ncbi:MAG: histidine kinase [Lentimicrobiaceae bacterium]|nr:histidine kinase [Lentimicrobiaceae bacterium]
MKNCFTFNNYLCLVCILFVFLGCNSPKKDIGNISPRNPVFDSLWTATEFETTDNEQLDSLLHLAAISPVDSNLAKLYFEIAEMYEDNDFEQAKNYYSKFGNLSYELSWSEGIYLHAGGFSNLLVREGLTDSALVVLQKAYELAVRENSEANKANIIFSKGNAYFMKEWYKTALSCYMDALSIYEKRVDNKKIQQLYYMMAQLYQSIFAVDKAIEYGQKSVLLNHEDPFARLALAMAYSSAHQYGKAKEYYEDALQLSVSQNNTYLMGLCFFHIANDALFTFDLKRAEKYALQSMEINQEFGQAVYFTDLILLSKLEQVKGDYVKSEEYAKEALQIATEINAPKEKRTCYMILSELAVAQHKYHETIQYWEASNLLEIDIAKEMALRAAEEMETQYVTEKNELTIKVLREEKRLYSWIIIAGGVGLFLALAVFFFLWRLNVQGKRVAEQQKLLAEQQLKQAEQEQQIFAAQAALDAENAERSRLAKDLHDGLGSMLSLIKITLPKMESGEITKTEDLEQFNKALGMLDNSIDELRRVAHHMMPESLLRYGVKASLNDFCCATPNAIFHYFGNEQRLDSKLEILIYRAAHELINNALKHSKASQISVQLVQEDDRISLTVYDNGKGFDSAATFTGMGLDNIRKRVEAYNGKMAISSSPEHGTEVNLEISIEN